MQRAMNQIASEVDYLWGAIARRDPMTFSQVGPNAVLYSIVSKSNASISGNYFKVFGDNDTLTLDHSFVWGNSDKLTGDDNQISGNSNTVTGLYNAIIGDNNRSYGDHALVTGNDNILHGNDDTLHGDNGLVVGDRAWVYGNSDHVYGTIDYVAGNNNFVAGWNDWVSGNNNKLLGTTLRADGDGNTFTLQNVANLSPLHTRSVAAGDHNTISDLDDEHVTAAGSFNTLHLSHSDWVTLSGPLFPNKPDGMPGLESHDTLDFSQVISGKSEVWGLNTTDTIVVGYFATTTITQTPDGLTDLHISGNGVSYDVIFHTAASDVVAATITHASPVWLI